MNPDLDNWDPMLQDFASGKKYENGPGADLITNEADQNEEANKIILKNIPHNITVEGIRNLCLSAGEPISVNITPSGDFAVVSFKTVREAELAIRDLNNTPPYFCRAKFKTGNSKDSNSNESIEGNNSDKRWTTESFYKCFPTEKHHLNENLKGKTIIVSPYFQICSEHDDPSLIMRQKKLDFKTKKECISMGRGYINMGDLDRWKYKSRRFTVQSDNWIESDCETTRCDYCGSMTFRNYKENYCSYLCQYEVKSNVDNSFKSTIFDYFITGASGLLSSLKKQQDGLIRCCVVLDKESDRYKRILEFNADTDEIVSARKGDRVIIHDPKGQIHRGVVRSNEGDFYRVALIDCGETVSVETVYRVPDELWDIPSFGGVARFSTDYIPDFTPVKFRAKERQILGSWLCDIINDNNDVISEMLLEEWSVPGSWTHVPLESGCSVIITSFKDMKTVYVRRIDGNWNDDFIRLSNDISGYSLEAKKYSKLPKLDEMCSARYKNDGCFYRAVVRSVRRKSACVMFVDYGNEQETELEDLRYLPNKIRHVNCFATRVRLKDGAVMSSPESVNYLNQLTAYGRELRLKMDKREVILTDEANGEVVNDIISELVRPVWQKDSTVFLKSGEAYFVDSIEELEFRPGEREDIFVMHVDAEEFATSGTFWGTQNRSDYLGHLNGELKQRITEYCSCLADYPYLPRTGELCLVEFQGDWYRGVSLDDRASPSVIFLVDFGIFTPMETKQMRKILREFLEMPALALNCKIAGFRDLGEDKRKKMSEYMIKMNKKLLRSVNVLRKVDDIYEVSIQELLGL